MIQIAKTIKIANRIGNMIELVREITETEKVFCPFFGNEIKTDKDGNIFVTEQAAKAKKWFVIVKE